MAYQSEINFYVHFVSVLCSMSKTCFLEFDINNKTLTIYCGYNFKFRLIMTHMLDGWASGMAGFASYLAFWLGQRAGWLGHGPDWLCLRPDWVGFRTG